MGGRRREREREVNAQFQPIYNVNKSACMLDVNPDNSKLRRDFLHPSGK